MGKGKVKGGRVGKYWNRTIGSFIELRMVGESYEATSWRSGPLSIVSIVSIVLTQKKKTK